MRSGATRIGLLFVFGALWLRGQQVEAGRARFNVRCAGCHGLDGAGGERAPAIGKGSRQHSGTEAEIRTVIRQGLPDRGMPGFDLNEQETQALTAFVRSRMLPLADTPAGGNPSEGQKLFFGNGKCAGCHMVRGRGSWNGPDLTEAARRMTLPEFEASLRDPSAKVAEGYAAAAVTLADGTRLTGFIRNESGFDMQLQARDGRFHFLRRPDIRSIERGNGSSMPKLALSPDDLRNLSAFLREAPRWIPGRDVPEPKIAPDAVTWQEIVEPRTGSWPGYNGRIGGNRFSDLDQISKSSVPRLAPRWSFPAGGGPSLETTPVVVNGVMYVTAVNTVYALDARTGRRIWMWSRPRSKGLVGDAAGGINRGVAVLGDRVFLATDNAHLIALHRITGGLLWEAEIADSRQHYGATSAPLVVDDLVISGVSGGDEGVRGLLAAFRAATGERVWTFWTIPTRSDPEAATWQGRDLEHGCGATWFTGTFDAATKTLFWPVGNPCPDFDGEERKGDNLYTDSVLALDPVSGKRKWHYQFTPHDLHDWDATETPMLVDANYGGSPRKLLLHGNRNGFFYVLDRVTGKVLSATPFVKKLTWATGIGVDGRPILTSAWQPTIEGTEVCPSMDGASNWMSPAFHPGTGLFYLMALEKCNVYVRRPETWKQGESFYGGAARPSAGEAPRKYVRAIDVASGRIRWEYEQSGRANSWGGLLATAGGLLFVCDDSGAFVALDAASGAPLWHYSTNARWRASPMTYALDGRQYVAVATGATITSFALPE